jgi:arylsulfate sulfotransferase
MPIRNHFIDKTFAVLVLLICAAPSWGMTVGIRPSAAAPVPVGSTITLAASVADPAAGDIWYRFRVRAADEAGFRMVRDYTPANSLEWVPVQNEGVYEIEVSARNRDSGETSSTVLPYEISSRVTGDMPVISVTGHPLVFLYSAPACSPGSRMAVVFVAPDQYQQQTHWMDCVAGKSINVYLAGFRPETDYTVRHAISSPDGTFTYGPVLALRSGGIPYAAAATRPLVRSQTSSENTILLQSRVFELTAATDLDGYIVWYVPNEVRYLTRAEPGGYFFALFDTAAGDDSQQILRVIDLVGSAVQETNAGRINEQLVALGKHPITSFHHEARRLPNGKIMVLAGTERLLTDVQGPGEHSVLGDTILVLDKDLQVEWVWDAFDHLDVQRAALLGEVCTLGTGGCAIFRLADVSNDWLHGNSLALTPDGSIIYSARHQDWVIKINYANGSGSGEVLWRLGKGGDFQIVSNDRDPWFSHQHDANFPDGGPANELLVFDNGNSRHETNENAHSRGQVYQIDETTRTARLILNVDLGSYALALGSAQRLANGNYQFGAGWIPNRFSHSLEYDRNGGLVTQIEAETQQYRSFRMKDLYTP